MLNWNKQTTKKENVFFATVMLFLLPVLGHQVGVLINLKFL